MIEFQQDELRGAQESNLSDCRGVPILKTLSPHILSLGEPVHLQGGGRLPCSFLHTRQCTGCPGDMSTSVPQYMKEYLGDLIMRPSISPSLLWQERGTGDEMSR